MSIFSVFADMVFARQQYAAYKVMRELDDDQRLAKARGFADYIDKVASIPEFMPTHYEPARRRVGYRCLAYQPLYGLSGRMYASDNSSTRHWLEVSGYKILYAINVYARQK